jgi:streptomycin 6-kinase
LAAFEGRGAVRVLEYSEGAVLLEQAVPGYSLRELVLDARDDEATDILADVIRRMSPKPVEATHVAELGASFEKYLVSGDHRIQHALVSEAQQIYRDLCRTQHGTRLLHGDLHHQNVIFDATRGWLAIDPKGVIGEVEFEIGAALRNPFDRPGLFASAQIAEQRICRFASRLSVSAGRVRLWAFAQAVLSAIWMIEDRQNPEPEILTLANLFRPRGAGTRTL